MHILALSWRDISHPKAGGAEVYSHADFRRLIEQGHTLTHVGCSFAGGAKEEVIDGVRYLRRGNPITVVFQAMRYYFGLEQKPDIVIDQCNTHRFFTPLWLPKKQKRVLFIHQLTRELWFAEPVIGIPVLNRIIQAIGYLTETLMLKLYASTPTMTVCESTRQELEDVGIQDIVIIPEGKDTESWPEEQWKEKQQCPTFIYAGRYVAYKQVDHVLRAFFLLLEQRPDAKLWLLGKATNRYVETVLKPMINTPEKKAAVEFLGFVSEEEKFDRISRSHALLYASKREGWGIPTIEAACVGTPSIVYDVPGLRDAVDFGRAGILLDANTPEALAEAMGDIAKDIQKLQSLQKKAYTFSDQFHWNTSASQMEQYLCKL